jgi:hypothetical protein
MYWLKTPKSSAAVGLDSAATVGVAASSASATVWPIKITVTARIHAKKHRFIFILHSPLLVIFDEKSN